MTKEELKQEAEEWLNKWELCNKCNNKVACIVNKSFCELLILNAYLASAELREKQIKELEKENAELKRIVKMVAMINKGIYTPEGIKAISAEAEQFLKEE